MRDELKVIVETSRWDVFEKDEGQRTKNKTIDLNITIHTDAR